MGITHISSSRPTTLLGHPLPEDWLCQERDNQRGLYTHQLGNLSVIESVRVEQDGRRWLHVSIARRESLPTWTDMHLVKHVWIGDERTAIQVFPPASEYVNFHPHCLHLFYCLERKPVLPDFTWQVVNPLAPRQRSI